MKRPSCRSFLAASAAFAAAPAWAAPRRKSAPQPEQPTTVDVIIVGAGAAGIAAARRLIAAGRRVALIEASATVGGRCITDTATFGTPYDLGAHWMYAPDINPMAKLATQTGLDIYPAPAGQRVRVGRRYARENELEDYLAALVRANTAIADAARKADGSCEQALPKDLGDWRPTIEFFLGPFGCGKDLREVSTADFVRSAEHDTGAFCRQGFGAVLAKLAARLPVQLSAPVTRIDYGHRNFVMVESVKGRVYGGVVILTASTSVLAAGKIKLVPDLPRRHQDALNKLKLGSYDHVTLELPGNPFDLRVDELVLEKSAGPSTAALFANASGSPLCMVEVAGSFGRQLAAKGEQEMIAFALEWLTGLYGIDVKAIVKRTHATRWNEQPYVMGAFSTAAPGAQAMRKVLAPPLNRLVLAGEATHETLWGTVGGAWESGERAADAAMKLLTRR